MQILYGNSTRSLISNRVQCTPGIAPDMIDHYLDRPDQDSPLILQLFLSNARWKKSIGLQNLEHVEWSKFSQVSILGYLVTFLGECVFVTKTKDILHDVYRQV